MTDKSIADFPLPLRKYLTCEDGHISFGYAYQTGTFYSILRHIDEELQRALASPRKDRLAAIRRVAASVAEARAEQSLIARQWDEELERRAEIRAARREACGL